jgi:hypothetical protein
LISGKNNQLKVLMVVAGRFHAGTDINGYPTGGVSVAYANGGSIIMRNYPECLLAVGSECRQMADDATEGSTATAEHAIITTNYDMALLTFAIG